MLIVVKSDFLRSAELASEGIKAEKPSDESPVIHKLPGLLLPKIEINAFPARTTTPPTYTHCHPQPRPLTPTATHIRLSYRTRIPIKDTNQGESTTPKKV